MKSQRELRQESLAAKALAKGVDTYARESGEAAKRVRTRISHVMLCGALCDAIMDGAIEAYVKGGAAMELRLGRMARTSKDIDIAVLGKEALRLFDLVLERGYDRFEFSRKETLELPNGVYRIEVGVTFASKPWGTVLVDLSSSRYHQADLEHVDIDLEPLAVLALSFPPAVPVLGRFAQVAEKLHAMLDAAHNPEKAERARDLIDLLIIDRELLKGDYQSARTACEAIFRSRATLPWPPPLGIPKSWHPILEALAVEHDIPSRSGPALISDLERLVGRILGVELQMNYQYRFLVLAAQRQVPSDVEAALDVTTLGFETFRRMTENEGWRVRNMMQYPGQNTRAVLVVLERPLDVDSGS